MTAQKIVCTHLDLSCGYDIFKPNECIYQYIDSPLMQKCAKVSISLLSIGFVTIYSQIGFQICAWNTKIQEKIQKKINIPNIFTIPVAFVGCISVQVLFFFILYKYLFPLFIISMVLIVVVSIACIARFNYKLWNDL